MLLAQNLSEKHQVIIATPDIGRVSKDFKIISNDKDSIIRCFKSFKPDIVNSHTFYLTPELIKLCKRHKVPLVLTVHGDIFGFGSDSDKKLLRSMIPKLDFVITVCNHGRKQLLKNGANSNKITRIYPGIDLKLFNNTSKNKKIFRNSFQLASDKFIFITPARMTRYKGIEILLEAIKNLSYKTRSKSLFWITTPATRYRNDELEYTRKIFKKADSLGIKDNLILSFSDFSSMPFAYKAANAFILPSLTEQFPVVILEALLSRLPIISTNVGGIREVLNKNNSFLVNSGDPKQLAAAIEKVYKFPCFLRTDLSVKQIGKTFNIDRMASDYLKLYKNIINGRKRQ